MNELFYGLATGGLVLSWIKSPTKTKQALLKAWKSFENILPQFLTIVLIIGLVLSVLSADQISALIGKESGWFGVLLASILGSITLIPGFIAFPLAAALRENGAGMAQLAAFISTLMMVGVVTLSMEISYFGKKAAFLRNGLAFGFSLVVAIVMGLVLA
jgi:uncharacterized membrane protein YraQ (UPF0718 family)